MYHPHLHCLVPAGGLSPNGKKWVKSRRKFFLPIKVVSRLFRGKFLALLKKAFKEGKLKLLGKLKHIKDIKTLNDFLRPIYKKEWIVFVKPPFGGPQQVINYLGRYTHRVAISNERILKLENDQVTFGYKDYKEEAKKKVMTLDAQEFIRRFLLHILPRGFHKIRYYGLLATRNRKTQLPQARKAVGQTPFVPHEKVPWFELLQKITGIDPLICPKCKNGKMNHKQLILPQQRAPPTAQLLLKF